MTGWNKIEVKQRLEETTEHWRTRRGEAETPCGATELHKYMNLSSVLFHDSLCVSLVATSTFGGFIQPQRSCSCKYRASHDTTVENTNLCVSMKVFLKLLLWNDEAHRVSGAAVWLHWLKGDAECAFGSWRGDAGTTVSLRVVSHITLLCFHEVISSTITFGVL